MMADVINPLGKSTYLQSTITLLMVEVNEVDVDYISRNEVSAVWGIFGMLFRTCGTLPGYVTGGDPEEILPVIGYLRGRRLMLPGRTQEDTVEYPQVWNPEEMAGNLTLLGTNKVKQPVQVKVYRTSIEHFAVLYPQKKVCRPLGVLNLKNTMVERLPSPHNPGFTIRQCGFDTPLCSLTFHCDTNRELERWISAFTCRSKGASSRTNASSLPVVEEGEEV